MSGVGTLSLPTGALAASDPLRLGLVGWYRMQGDVNDHSGNGNNGSVVNGPLTAVADKWGNAGGGYGFTYASSQYVSLARNNALPIYSTTAPYSVAAWFYSAHFNGVIYSEGGSSLSFQRFNLSTNTDGSFGVDIQLSNATYLLRSGTTVTATKAASNTWTHVVWTDNAGAAKMYVNGALDSTSFTYAPSAFSAANQCYIAASAKSTGLGSYQTASMSDIRIYNRALSAAEAYTLAKATQRI